MRKSTAKKKINVEIVTLYTLLGIGIVFCFLLLWNIFGKSSSNNVRHTTRSDVINTKEIETLSVSEFVYNGIAQSLKENGEPDYNVLYNATVKVSVDSDKTDFHIDESTKTIRFVFPEFTIEKPIIDIGSVRFIPSRNDLYMDDVINLCREDAYNEAQNSNKLILSAQENLRAIMEAWYSPVLEEYTFEYQFASAESGETE